MCRTHPLRQRHSEAQGGAGRHWEAQAGERVYIVVGICDSCMGRLQETVRHRSHLEVPLARSYRSAFKPARHRMDRSDAQIQPRIL